jgi:glycosyltransferase involved in cell wall biosynthesis
MFTVLIPLYNKAPYIQRALDSVYAQTYQPSEILIVNDGSTDGSDEIVRRQASPLIRMLDQPNQGVSVARNNGLAAAAHPYVAFLDADDRWRPGFLQSMRTAIEAFPRAFLYGAGFATVASGRIKRECAIPAGRLGPAAAREVDFFRVCSGGHPLHISTTVVPRTSAIAIGGFAAGVEFCEDHLFWAKLALRGSVVLTPEVLADYDVEVPGQAVEVWGTAYKERVLEYHKFIAFEMRGRSATTPMERSFRSYSRRVLQTALFQRFYWANFPAIRDLWGECELANLGLGGFANACAWVAAHPFAQPPIAVAMKQIRQLRAFGLSSRDRQVCRNKCYPR